MQSNLIILHIKLLNESNLIILQLSYFMKITYNILSFNKVQITKDNYVNKYK